MIDQREHELAEHEADEAIRALLRHDVDGWRRHHDAQLAHESKEHADA